MNYKILSPQIINSEDGINSNVLILLQGFGDTSSNFSKFAQKMQLPQTALVTMNAPVVIEGFGGWFEKIDMLTGDEIPFDSVKDSVRKTSDMISLYISENLMKTWPAERIFVLGFGDGGEVAVNIGKCIPIGGIVSISAMKSINETLKTDCLVTVEENCETEIIGQKISLVKIPNKVGVCMPSSSFEMERIMSFFAKRLWLRNINLEKMAGVYQVQSFL